MAKNPVIQKARQDGYSEGFQNGVKAGFEQGKYSACMYFASRFEGLKDVKGIGPKTFKIIVEEFGQEYFEVANEDEKQKKAEKKA